jgi:heme-degrading monooxygenase HmoA
MNCYDLVATALQAIDSQPHKMEVKMAVKVLIKRSIPGNKGKEIIPLFRQMRSLATQQPGYISGETLKRSDDSNTFLVISTWQTSEDWEKWFQLPERKEVLSKIDALLGGKTDYEVYHYGFSE